MRLLILITFILSLSGCSLQEDFDYTSHQELIVVNGFLHPDSIISIKVSQTAPYPHGNTFNSINHASVKLYENGRLLSQIPYNQAKQAYVLNYYPKETLSYRLVVKVANQDSLFATTSIPANSTSEACYSPFPEGINQRFNGNIKLDINIKKNDPAAVLWLGLTSKAFASTRIDIPPYTIYDSSSVKTESMTYIYSNSSAIDRFNGTLDEGLNSYSFVMRLNPAANINDYQVDAFSFETDKFYTYRKIQNLPESLGLYVHVYTTSEDFDRYWKTSLLYFLNNHSENDIPNPFAEQIVNYSNISNGTGIFAGYNSQTIAVHKTKCR